MSGFTTFAPEQIAAAQLEPSFEMTLRAADISEEVNTVFRVHRIKNAVIFAAMDNSVEELQINRSRSIWRRHCEVRSTPLGGMANIHNAWLAVKVNQE